jgi:outer membrane biosynthesis protein TonB
MMSARRGWSEQRAVDQGRFLNLLVGSFVVHAACLGILAVMPSPDAPLRSEVLRVDLVARLPAPAAPPKRVAKAPPAAAPVPPPKPLPKALPKPAPKQIVLPKRAPKAVASKRPPAPRRVAPIEYEDALSQLRNELGESPASRVEPEPVGEPVATAIAPTGAVVDRELLAWVLATQRHVRSRYITPPEFLNRSLATDLEVLLTRGGELVGLPRVVGPSGDPFFDDNAMRAVMTSAPLPAPPDAGFYTFVFTSEER